MREIIGRDAHPFWEMYRYPVNVDYQRTDYKFWDELRNGRAQGFELVGLLVKPLTELIASYVFGEPPVYSLVERPEDDEDPRAYTNEVLDRFVRRNHMLLMGMITDLYALGDQFVIMNPNGTVSIPSPDWVDPKYSLREPGKLESVTVRIRNRGINITETYTAEKRTVVYESGGRTATEEFDNVIGRLPVVHFANNRRTNEMFGRADLDACYHLLSMYDDLYNKGIQGARVMGNPIPVMEGMKDIDKTISANKTGQDDPLVDGEAGSETRATISFDTNGMMFVGEGGRFELKAPPRGFTQDIREMLQSLLETVITHVRVPEFMLGKSTSGNRAGTEMQLPPVVRFIELKRAMLDGEGADDMLEAEPRSGMYQLLDLYLRTRRLTDPKIVVEPVQSQWPNIDLADENVKLQKVIYARGIGGLSLPETVGLLNLIPNPQESVRKAREEYELAMSQNDDFAARLNAAAHQDMNPASQIPQAGMDQLADAAPPDPDGGRNVKVNATQRIGELEEAA